MGGEGGEREGGREREREREKKLSYSSMAQVQTHCNFTLVSEFPSNICTLFSFALNSVVQDKMFTDLSLYLCHICQSLSQDRVL